MPRPRKPYLHKETNRHGRTVWYVRNKDVGGKRTRIRGEYGSVEFNRNYDIAVADMFNRPRLAIDPNEAFAKVFNGSLKWLWEEYKAKAPDWREMKASTHKQRNTLMTHVLEANGNGHHCFTASGSEFNQLVADSNAGRQPANCRH